MCGLSSPPPLCKHKGLISAAKFVAMSTQQLVAAANSLAEGKLNDAALIAAAKGIILLFIIYYLLFIILLRKMFAVVTLLKQQTHIVFTLFSCGSIYSPIGSCIEGESRSFQ